jgi:uncharacterized ubiquitin-like protein YukD
MQSAIVTVKWQGVDQAYDLEVPTGVPSRQLTELIAHNLNLSLPRQGSLAVNCIKPAAQRRTLGADESLAEAGLWDGVYLEIGRGSVSDAAWGPIMQKLVVSWVPLEGDASPPQDRPPTRATTSAKAREAPARTKSAPAIEVEFEPLVPPTSFAPSAGDSASAPNESTESYIFKPIEPPTRDEGRQD